MPTAAVDYARLGNRTRLETWSGTPLQTRMPPGCRPELTDILQKWAICTLYYVGFSTLEIFRKASPSGEVLQHSADEDRPFKLPMNRLSMENAQSIIASVA